eukprot:scaffold97165_cov19-Tisochrysis_lutea.AAC.1
MKAEDRGKRRAPALPQHRFNRGETQDPASSVELALLSTARETRRIPSPFQSEGMERTGRVRIALLSIADETQRIPSPVPSEGSQRLFD